MAEGLNDVQESQPNWHAKAEDHRRMARAAIRVALRHGIKDSEILAEYEEVLRVEGVTQ